MKFPSGFQILVFLLSCSALVAQTPWSSVGPAGGDARSFAAVPSDPSHLYLGTTNSWLYESSNGGASWHRLARLGPADDLALDHIVVEAADPTTVYVAAWTISHPDGGLWVSHNAGKSFTELAGMHGQSIRAFVQAPSNPKLLFAGTLQGVFRSSDAGSTWQQISPPNSQEIHEVESLAIDPVDPNIVYAGTWHLPWKTTDGGKNWHNIKQGVIDDSDVFSIIIDPKMPSVVYASACSGIYKSENFAELFKKIQGIPSTARRTRVLKQDPLNRDVVYAGTTQGLYKSLDAGKTFQPMTGPDTIVNDVFVDPRDSNHVLLATDRNGVLYSKDGASSFVAANDGFSARKVEALLVDNADPARLFAGVLNDKTYGGVFVSSNGGASWDHIAEGLDGRDIFALAQSPQGAIVAGTNSGIFQFNPATSTTAAEWVPLNTIQNSIVKQVTVLKNRKRVTTEKLIPGPPSELEGRVYTLDLSADAWFAYTAAGLLTSRDHGATWQGAPVLGSSEFVTGAVHGSVIAAARRDGLVLSSDAGQTWTPVEKPSAVSRINRVLFTPDGSMWLATREGVYVSHDQGKTWQWMERLPMRDVDDISYDAQSKRVLVSSRSSDWIFAIDPAALNWTWSRTGFGVFLIRAAAGRMVAASLYDGVLLAPLPQLASMGARASNP